MKRSKTFLPIFTTIIFLTASACSFKDAGRNLGADTIQKLFSETDTLKLVGGKLTQGALDSLLSEQTTERLVKILDSLGVRTDAIALRVGENLSNGVNGDLTHFKDVLFADARSSAGSIRDDLLGAKTRKLVRTLLSDVLGDSTLYAIAMLRDTFFDDSLHEYIETLADSVGAKTGGQVADKLAEVLEKSEKSGRGLLITLGIVGAALLVLAWFLFHRGHQYRNISRVITNQIHHIDDRKEYDTLTGRIRAKSQEEGLEPFLRNFLKKQGILGEEAWEGARSKSAK